MKIIKNIAIFSLICLLSFYLALYLALPYFLNKRDYSKIITDSIRKNTGLVLVVHKYKLAVSPSFSINLQAKEIQLFYPDKRQIMDLKNAEFNVSALYLLKKELKLNKVKADEFQFSTKLLKSGKTTFQEYIENNVKTEKSDFKISSQIPKIKIKKYIFKLKDEESGQKFKLSGKDFKVSQNIDLAYLDFESAGEFFCADKKYLNYKLKLAVPKNLFKDTNKALFDISADNLYKYPFYANLDANVKIHEKNNRFHYLSGQINIDNFSLKIGNHKLPASYFHITTDKGRANVTSKFYTDVNESTDIKANVKITKPYEIDMTCHCPKADISNLQKLSISVLEILKIKNNLKDFTATGRLNADFSIKTNLKTLKSNGTLKIQNGNISHRDIPLKISNINALVDFSDNTVKIKHSNILVNNQPLKINGTIDAAANGDLFARAENLDLNHIMNAFPVLKPDKNIIIKSGKLSFSARIKGQLLTAAPQINAIINNFEALETNNKIKLKIKALHVDATANKDKYSGTATINNIQCSAKGIPNQSNSITAEKITANFDKKSIKIIPAKINAGNAKLTLSGEINDYLHNTPFYNITASGTIDTALIKDFLFKDINNILYKGYLPVNANIKGYIKDNTNNAKINIKVLANNYNYITPFIVKSFGQKNSLTNITAKITDNTINLEDFSLHYAQNINNLLKDVNVLNLKKAITAKGKIQISDNDIVFDKLHISIPESLKITIPVVKGGETDVLADLVISGTQQKPAVYGHIILQNLKIAQYLIDAQKILLNINKENLSAQIELLKIKDTNVSITANTNIKELKTNKIKYLQINAQHIDMDYITALMPLFKQAVYGPGCEFPFIISSGKLNVKSFKMGNIKAENITADISSERNILYLKKLFATAYGGNAAGKIKYNFPYSTIHADIQGRNMNARLAAADFMPKSQNTAGQEITGNLNFDSSIDIFGTTPEQQIKTLKGNANVLIKNGRLGQLGRFEHFLYAQNLLAQRLIYASINSAKQAISPKDTGYITYLKGVMRFDNGYMYLNPVLTSGPQMSMYITGSINLINNYTDLKILGRVSQEILSASGEFGTMTIKDFLDAHTKYGPAAEKIFNSYNAELPEADISRIPQLSPDYKYTTKNFKVVISGAPESIKAVKSFTWINPIGTKQKMLLNEAETLIKKVSPQNAKPQNSPATPPAGTQTIQQPNTIPTANPTAKEPDFLNSIPDTFKN